MFAPKVYVIFITLASKQICPLFYKEILPLSSKYLHYTNILENIGQNKSSQYFDRRAEMTDLMKDIYTLENFFPRVSN